MSEILEKMYKTFKSSIDTREKNFNLHGKNMYEQNKTFFEFFDQILEQKNY